MIDTAAFLMSKDEIGKDLIEFDLVSAVREALIRNALADRVSVYDNSPMVQYASNKIFEVQRLKLNEYFSIQFMSTGEDTIDARFCLVDTGSPQEWMNLFESSVVKRLSELGLPNIPV